MTAMGINSFTYALDVAATSTTLTIRPDIVGQRSMIITNAGANAVLVFMASGSPTAVFPTSGGAPVNGTVILPGTVQTFSCDDRNNVLAAISISGTNRIYIQMGSGE